MLLKKEPAPIIDPDVLMRQEWMEELLKIQARLDQNERYFNMISDFDMTEVNIHERSALEMRYRYYLTRIREHDRTHRPTGEIEAEREPTPL